jgi:DNA-binding response OmpR family regulator
MESLINVLCLDDDKDFNNIVKLRLKQYNKEVDTAVSPSQFYEILEEKNPDLCLIDLNLTYKGQGIEIINQVKSQLGSIMPIIALSRTDDEDIIGHTMKAGADDFVSKPFDDFILDKKMNYLLNTKVSSFENMTFVPPENQGCFLVKDFEVLEFDFRKLILTSHVFIEKGTLIRLCEKELPFLKNRSVSVKVSKVRKEGFNYILEFHNGDETNIEFFELVRSEIFKRHFFKL